MIEDWLAFLERYHRREIGDDELASWQEQWLPRVLLHAQARSVHYGRVLAGRDVSVVTPDGLAELPFTTKQDLSTGMYDLLSGDVSEGAYFFATTGTTGRSTPCPRSLLDFRVDNYGVTRSLEATLDAWLPHGDRRVIAMLAPNETHSVCLTTSMAAAEVGALKIDAFPLSPAIGFPRLYALLEELRPNVLIGSPGQLLALAELAPAYGSGDVATELGVRLLLTTGELCTLQMAQVLARAWDARAYNWWYGSQEAGTSAMADPDAVMHLLEANYLVEVLDPEDQTPLQGAAQGELCLTNLVPGLKPLIRYRTGDLVEVEARSGGRREVRFLGRVKDVLVLDGARHSAAEVERAVLGEHAEVLGYQVQVTRAFDGADELLVRVRTREDRKDAVSAIELAITRQLGVRATVEVVPALDLVTATGGWVSWKAARVVDVRAAGDDDETYEAAAAADLVRSSVERA